MDFSLKQNSLSCYQKLAVLSGAVDCTAESVVPDTQEDILRILGTAGFAAVRTKNAADGVVSVTGEVMASVLYVPESGEGAAALSVNVPFSFEQRCCAEGEVLPVASVRLMALEARLLNPRKVLVRATVCVETVLYASSRLLWYSPDEGGAGACLRVKTAVASVSVVTAVTEKTFLVSDVLPLPAGKPAPAKILGTASVLRVTDAQSVGGKLIVKGMVRTVAHYLSAEGGLECVSAETAFSQLVETGGGTDFTVTPLLTDAFVERLSAVDGSSPLSLEVHGVLQVAVREKREIEYITDAYCVGRPLTAERAMLTAETDPACAVTRAAARGQFELQRPCTGVVSVNVLAGAAAAQDGKASVSLTAELLYLADGGGLYGERFSLTAAADCDGGAIAVAGAEAVAVPAGMSVELRAQVDFTLTTAGSVQLAVVSALSSPDDVPPRTRPSVTVIRTGETDLWTLAKAFGADEDEILRCNGLEEREIPQGVILLIP